MLQLNTIADFEEALTRHEQELQSFRHLFNSYSEHVVRLNNNSIAIRQDNQRLRAEVEALKSKLSALEQKQTTEQTRQKLKNIFAACTSVLNWCVRRIGEIARNFRQNPHLE